jgi:Putative restriction endonuclease
MVARMQTRPVVIAPPTMNWRERSGLTIDDVEQLALAGAFTDYDDLELIGGRLVQMSPAGRRHEVVKEALTRELMRLTLTCKALSHVFVAAEPQFNLSDDEFAKPDVLLRPIEILPPDVHGSMALVVIEVRTPA